MSNATRYRTPVVYQDVRVSLDDFDDDDICEYLRHRGYAVGGSTTPCEIGDPAGGPVPGEGPLVLDEEDLDRIRLLSICGQREPARDYLCAIVGRWIGRKL